MRILVTLFEIQDYGGIAQSHELMMKGLMAQGHKCDFVIMRCNDRDPYIRKDTGPKGSHPSVMGGEVHTLAGWYGQRVIGYGSAKHLKAYQKMAKTYDLIIHQIPVPKPDPKGYWSKIYEVDTTQIAWIHDANFRDLYPHLVLVAHKLVGVTTSNQAGYESASWLPVPRAFMGVPHELLDWESMRPWNTRSRQTVCAHVWKAWKRMHLAVEAIPHLERGKIVMGGDGIEGRYMRSRDKCKPKYAGIWKRARRAGMDYRGLMTHDELFDLYRESRCMLDLSYSNRFAHLGSHFNRSTLEAFNCGLVPIVTDINMIDNFDAQVSIWKEGRTHVAVPYDAEPRDIADIVQDAMYMSQSNAERIIANGRKILKKHFDYRNFAKDLIELACRRPCGVYPKLEMGTPPSGFYDDAKKFVKEKTR